MRIPFFNYKWSSRQRHFMILTKKESSPACLELIFPTTI
uniref:Uncharacterized protein n=1 Tax=Rhizophora mucronata TaxID=61149 RepID=A0A2P2KGP4_RHIMU